MGRILIAGVGNIGSKLYEEYAVLKPDRYDPHKGYDERSGEYDIAFIAVDTPMKEDGSCDLSQVENAIASVDAKIYVLRSTVPPKTVERMKEETGKRIVFSPEFYGTTQHSDRGSFDFSFTILGGDRKDCNAVVQVLQEVYNANHRFCITDSTTAELAKYMENAMLAAKVSLCVQFWELANRFGVNYPELRELVLNDSRLNRAHTFVYDSHPYWDSHCFNKDLTAITHFASAPLIESIIDYNNKCKDLYGNNVSEYSE